MTPAQFELVARARESTAAAKLLLANGYAGFAVSRAYYAMFYLAEALLEGKGLAFSKHAAVVAAFGREFVKTGEVPAELHRFLLQAQELRQAGDYGEASAIGVPDAQEQIDRAEQFMRVVERALGAPPQL